MCGVWSRYRSRRVVVYSKVKIARDSTKGEIVNVDYAREYGIDVEVLRLEHPAQPGQMRAKRVHEMKAETYWNHEQRIREIKEGDVGAMLVRLRKFDLDKHESMLVELATIRESEVVTKEMREGSYEFTPEQLMQAHLAYDRREAAKFPPQRVDYGK